MKPEQKRELDKAVKALESAQRLLGTEIASYPTPISGCDAQFNYLLSQRAMISNALHALASPPFIPTSRQLEPEEAST